MKARIKETGEIVEVCPDVLAGFLADNGCYYKNEELSTELDDWQAFRREAAKDILVGLCANNNIGYYGDSNTALASSAIALTDELIKQLKEQ